MLHVYSVWHFSDMNNITFLKIFLLFGHEYLIYEFEGICVCFPIWTMMTSFFSSWIYCRLKTDLVHISNSTLLHVCFK